MKLSKTQIEAVELLRKYPNEMIMFNGCLTGGHGTQKINRNTIGSLKNLGIIENNKITYFGRIVTYKYI